LNHYKADIISKANKSLWNPDIGFSKDAKPFDLPWKVIGNTIEDAVTITLSLKKDNFGKYCPTTKMGITVYNIIILLYKVPILLITMVY